MCVFSLSLLRLLGGMVSSLLIISFFFGCVITC